MTIKSHDIIIVHIIIRYNNYTYNIVFYLFQKQKKIVF